MICSSPEPYPKAALDLNKENPVLKDIQRQKSYSIGLFRDQNGLTSTCNAETAPSMKPLPPHNHSKTARTPFLNRKFPLLAIETIKTVCDYYN